MRPLVTLLSVLAVVVVAHAAPEEKLIVKPDAFPTLVNPNCSHCRDEAKRRAGELRPDDRVLCWTRGYSDGGAIPFRFFLNPYRVISDSYGVFVYDPDAGFARGFAPSFQFRFHGWRNGVMVMRHQDGTLYSGLSGLAFAGPNKGNRLEPVPTLVSDWGTWLDRYPDAVAYHMFDKYQPVELPTKLHADAMASRPPADPRLPESTVVLGVRGEKETRAYPLLSKHQAALIHDQLDGKPCVVLWQGRSNSAAAYRLEATPPRKHTAPRPNKEGVSPPEPTTTAPRRAVRLVLDRVDFPATFKEEATGSRFDVAGRCIEGELKGWTLTWLDSVQVKWIAWAAEYPETTIWEGKAPSRP
jgi:hypothetical protein